jgi:hypothetical protein
VCIKKQYNGGFTSPAVLLALAPPPRLPNGHDTTPSGSLTYTEEVRLRGALAVIPAEDRDTWLKVGAALHLHGAREVWDDWSKTSGKFNAADQDRVWASFHGERKEGVITVQWYLGKHKHTYSSVQARLRNSRAKDGSWYTDLIDRSWSSKNRIECTPWTTGEYGQKSKAMRKARSRIARGDFHPMIG